MSLKWLRCFVVRCNNEHSSRHLLPTSELLKMQWITFVSEGYAPPDLPKCICLCESFKSNHFYCHITTAHLHWWVKFLRACSRQCRNNLHIDSTYLQIIQMTMCNIHIHILSTHSVLLDILTVINTHYTPYVHILHYVHIYTHNNMRRYNRLYISWIRKVMDVHCMVSSGSR